MVLEPIMKVSVEGPVEFQGAMRNADEAPRGLLGTTEESGFARIDADVPLSEMFGYATVLRSATQGKAEFTMEFSRYGVAPAEVGEELLKQYKGKAMPEEE